MKARLLKSFCILSILVAGLPACQKKASYAPQNPQDDNEKITHVYLYLTDTTVTPHLVKTFAWSKMDVSVNPVITYDTLVAGTTYVGSVLLLDKTKNPVDTLSNEFESAELKLEHQFFYRTNPSSLIAFSYKSSDRDANGVPVGTMPIALAKTPGTGHIHMLLKHQPGAKPTSGSGDSTLGSTDLQIEFPVKVK